MKKNGKLGQRILAAVLSATMILSLGSGMSVFAQEPAAEAAVNDNDLRLWYTSPAPDTYNGWMTNSLPIGNGYMGSNVFGGVGRERLSLNEKTLWSGGPAEGRDYNGGNLESRGKNGETMKQIQQAFAEGNTSLANSLCNQLTGLSDDGGTQGYGYYLSYGNMYLEFPGMSDGNAQNYVRDLDMKTAIASVNYDYDGVNYNREYFTSYPDNMMVARLTASEAGKLTFNLSVNPDNTSGKGQGPNTNNGYQRTWTQTADGGLITIQGQLSDNQLKFASQTKVLNTGGTLVDNEDGTVSVTGADEVVILMTMGTDYDDNYPVYRTGQTDAELLADIQGRIDAATELGYEGLLKSHLADYQGIFDRVHLDLGQEVSQIPTNQLLTNYKNGSNTPALNQALEVLLYQYGRYLTIASSREGSLPSNLQGVWTGANNSPWHSDYHMNVNLQMNYWPTYSTNMAECAIPLIEYVDALRAPGRVTAKIYAGIESTEENPENGFMAHTQNNPYGWTCPGWSFDWGWSPAATPWIIQNCWEYYEYTGDLDYMKENIYPMLKEEARLYEQMLIEDPETGKLVCSPAYSPEHGPRTNGNTYEQSLIWQLFTDAIIAGKLVDEDQATLDKWQEILDNLKGPIEIGDSGQIKEWYEETTIESTIDLGAQRDLKHRHMSHLLGLFPGDLISVETPELLEAAKVSMDIRGDDSTGWAMGQRINSRARSGEGNRAYNIIKNYLFQKGIYNNLWDSHAPFQIDGNFGYTSGVTEMLMQSNMGYINLLPALPDAWSAGHIDGIVARGNFEISMDWEKKALTTATIKSNNGGECIVQTPDIALAVVRDADGNFVDTTIVSNNRISFNTDKGGVYTITGFPAGAEDPADAPANLTAYRAADDQTSLTWDAVAGEDVTYNVYRQINDGEFKPLATGVNATSYTDADGDILLGSLSYKVSAVVGGKETKLSDSALAGDVRNMTGLIDDRDPRVKFSDEWGTWNDGKHHFGTIKFIEQTVGGESIQFTFLGTGIKAIAPKNTMFGMMDVYIDGELVQENVDFYHTSSVAKQLVFSKEDLPYGVHTIKMVATGTKNPASSKTKLEFDCFEVLNTNVTQVSSINVGTSTGTDVIGVANGTLQMTAAVEPAEALQDVDWSVNNASMASIDANGVLTAKQQGGEVTVTATAKDGSGVVGTKTITIAIQGSTETIIEDSVNKVNPNPAITWNGSWSTWAGEPTRHHGGTKTESNQAGAYAELTFNGTGIEVYVQKHANFSSFDISIDGGEATNYSLNGSGSGDDQQLLFEKKDLENGTHTIRLTNVHRSGKTNADIDYFKVFTPQNTDWADKSDLHNEINEFNNLVESGYTAESWAAYKAAFDSAVVVMNNLTASAEDVVSAYDALFAARSGLILEKDTTAPTAPADLTAIGVEETTLLLKWSPSTDNVAVVGYEVYQGDDATSAVTVNGTSYRFNDLTPGTEYTFHVVAVDAAGNKSAPADYTVSTVALPDTEAPVMSGEIAVMDITRDTATVTWTPASDNNVVSHYEVYNDGVLLGTTEELSYNLTGLAADTRYLVKVRAVDASGNYSTPLSAIFRTAPEKEADKSILKQVIKGAEALVGTEEYNNAIPSVKLSFDAALAEARTVDSNLLATQQEVNEAWIKLMNEIHKLGFQQGDKTALQAAYDAALEVDQELYEDGQAKDNFNAAIAAAKSVLDDPDAMQPEIDKAKADLELAQSLLEMIVPDKTNLKKIIDQAESLYLDDYFDEGKPEFLAALEAAWAVYNDDNANVKEVAKAADDLLNAMLNLKLRFDKTLLNQVIAYAQTLDVNDYTDSTVVAFTEALAKAIEVQEKAGAFQPEIRVATDNLLDALLNLRYKADKSLLEKKVAEASAIDTSAFTPVSVDRYNRALAKANDLLANNDLSDADQSLIDAATLELDAAIAALDPVAPVQGDKTATTGSGTPRTGDAVPAAAAAMLLLSGAAVLFKKRNR